MTDLPLEVPALAIGAALAPTEPKLFLANLHVEDGEVSGLETATGLAFAFMLDVDKIVALFTEPMADRLYGWSINSTSGDADLSDRQLDYIEITISNTTEPFDISLQIFSLAS